MFFRPTRHKMASEQAFDDNDPSVYSSHVLYTVTQDNNSNAVSSRLKGMELGGVVYTQDVMTLTQRPHWLRGVPSLYCKTDQKVLTGVRDILAYASTWKNPDPVSMASSLTAQSGLGSGLGGNSLFDDSLFSIEGDPTTVAPTNQATGGQRQQRKAAAAASTASSVERLQNSRAEMDRRIQATAQQGTIPMPRNMMTAPREVPLPQHRRGRGGQW